MRPVIAVTGVDGFVGRHVVAAANEAGVDVVGLARNPIDDESLRADLVGEIAADLTEGWPDDLGADVDAVIHLAGLASVGPSFDAPQMYIHANSAMVTNLGEMLLRSERLPRVVAVSTGAVYRGGKDPLDEQAAVSPSSPYVVSKLLVENQVGYYAARGLDIVIARPFNHVGPGQGAGFLLPDLVSALRCWPGGVPLGVGNLYTARDYTDVRDVAAAYLALALSRSPLDDIYNVASGRALRGWDVLRSAADALDMDVPPVHVDRSRFRATDNPIIVGDAARIRDAVGWVPRIDFRKSVEDYVIASV